MFGWKKGAVALALSWSAACGAVPAGPLEWEARAEDGTRARGIAIAPDAGVYFLVDDGAALSLRRLGVDGVERWRTDVPGALGSAVGIADAVVPADDVIDIVQGGTSVCVAPTPRYRRAPIVVAAQHSAVLACFDAETGTPWLTRAKTAQSQPIPSLVLDGDVATWFEQVDCTAPCRPHVDRVTLARGGVETRRTITEITGATAAASGLAGRTFVGTAGSPAALVVVDQYGNRLDNAALGRSVKRIVPTPEGTIRVHRDYDTATGMANDVYEYTDRVAAIQANWSSASASRAASLHTPTFQAHRFLVDRGTSDSSSLIVFRTSGALRWYLPVSVPSHTGGDDAPASTLVYDDRLGLLFTTVDSAGQPLLTALRASDGHTLAFARMRCSGSARCATRTSAVDGNVGPYALVADATGSDGAHWAVVRWTIPDLFIRQPTHPILQAGLRGFWHARETPGQGFTFDVAGNGVFGSWFTFDDNDAAGWYVAQGTAEFDSGIAALTVYTLKVPDVAIPGAVSPPVLTAVGQARIALVDCNTAKLTYSLTPKAGGPYEQQAGSIVLDRSITRSFDCTPGIASQFQPIPIPLPAQGFERGQTGAWSDPANPAQGIVFDVRPPNPLDPGHVVGAWYLPYGEWFTLQAPIGNVQDGRLEMPMYRSIGGSRDRLPAQSIERVGRALVDFDGCGKATFDYAFDDTPLLNVRWRGKTGRWNLTRVTPCATD